MGNSGQLVTAETGCLVPWWSGPVFERILIELGLELNQDELAVLRKGLLAGRAFVESRDRRAGSGSRCGVIVQSIAELGPTGHDTIENQRATFFKVLAAPHEFHQQRSRLRIPWPIT